MEAKSKVINSDLTDGAIRFLKEAGQRWMDFEANTNPLSGLHPGKEKISRIIDEIIDWSCRISTFCDSSYSAQLNNEDLGKLNRLRTQFSDQLERAKRIEYKLSIVKAGKGSIFEKTKLLSDYFIPKKILNGREIINWFNSQYKIKRNIPAKDTIHLIRALIDAGIMLELNFSNGPIGSQSAFHKALQKEMTLTVNWTTFNKEYSRSLIKNYYDQELLKRLNCQINTILSIRKK